VTKFLAPALLAAVWAVCAVAEDGPSAPVVVTLESTAGEIDVAVFVDQAPRSAADFLRYVDRKLYDGAAFYRTVRPDNDHGTPSIEIIQGGLAEGSPSLSPVEHETTRDTGISHTDGTLSLARGAPGTGSGAVFFICLGNQPALDFGGTRNTDGLGFAAIGRVVRGMDVVRKIHAMPVIAPTNTDYMAGQFLAEPVVIHRAFRKPLTAVVRDSPETAPH
jgi:peptidyl-prolyl cis-trans isomerase A (cyclophilin A)